MGYYVDLIKVDGSSTNKIMIKKENLQAAYDALCVLNTDPQYDILKGGGLYTSDGVSINDERPEGLDYHPGRWFSWMDADYHKNRKTLEEILNSIGFDTHFDSQGNLSYVNYSDKTGNEDIFFCALAPFIEDGVEMIWRGEEGEQWKWVFTNGEMLIHQGRVFFTKNGKKATMKSYIKNAEDMNENLKEWMERLKQDSYKGTE